MAVLIWAGIILGSIVGASFTGIVLLVLINSVTITLNARRIRRAYQRRYQNWTGPNPT